MSLTIEPVKIFIGTDPRMWRGEAVLRYSIEKSVTGPVEIVSMDGTNGDEFWRDWNMGRPPGHPATRDQTPEGDAVWFTDFTNFRWAIPEACGFMGKAIYVDVDEVFLRDARELWNLPIPKHKGILTLYPGETSVMLFDCSYFMGLDWWPTAEQMRSNGWGIRRYLDLLVSHRTFAPFPAHWNCLDGQGYQAGVTSLIHYTDMATQPWRPYPERLNYSRHPSPVAESIWVDFYHEVQRQSGFSESLPPGAELPESVSDAFPEFLEQYESEKE